MHTPGCSTGHLNDPIVFTDSRIDKAAANVEKRWHGTGRESFQALEGDGGRIRKEWD